jgi:hypothetical protein
MLNMSLLIAHLGQKIKSLQWNKVVVLGITDTVLGNLILGQLLKL